MIIKNISCLSSDEVILLSAAISIALSKNRSKREIETLINISNLINDNLTSILAQSIICASSSGNTSLQINEGSLSI